jgi:hypothetical protein
MYKSKPSQKMRLGRQREDQETHTKPRAALTAAVRSFVVRIMLTRRRNEGGLDDLT